MTEMLNRGNKMNTFRSFFLVCVALVMGALAMSSIAEKVLAQPGAAGPVATMQMDQTRIIWQPTANYVGYVLRVADPSGDTTIFSFSGNQMPFFQSVDNSGAPRTDGLYKYELRAEPNLDAQPKALLAEAAQTVDRGQVVEQLRQSGKLPASELVQFGTFQIRNGAFVQPGIESSEGPAGGQQDPGLITPMDQVIADDLIVQSSACVGLSCVDGESFGFDTIRLKEDNLRIHFDDASVAAGFPNNDWRIVVNDSGNGGASYFAIEDAITGTTPVKTPFKIEAGSRTNSLYVASTGRIGLGTNSPAMSMHAVKSDTPGIRLDQDNTGGFTAQVWDVAGNEANFFIRDVTNASRLPFRVRPGAPTSSIDIAATGRVGFGTDTPAYAMELERTGTDATFVAQKTDGSTAMINATTDTVRIGSISNHSLELVVNSSPVMTVTAAGNVTLGGVLVEYSDRNAKENFTPVSGADILARLANIPVTVWNYRADDNKTRHMGPVAQDFYSAFGLGEDDRHIAVLDEAGVAFAAIQELNRIKDNQEQKIADLEKKNAELEARLAALESKINNR